MEVTIPRVQVAHKMQHQQQHLPTVKIDNLSVPPKTLTSIPESLAVTAILSLVDEEFKKRDNDLSNLIEQIQERERELEYCESETKKQVELLSILSSRISFRHHSFDKLQRAYPSFKSESIDPLIAEYSIVTDKRIRSKLLHMTYINQ